MARINIDDDLFIDPRFKRLSRKIGELAAIGTLVEFWFAAQRRWGLGELIPEQEMLPDWDLLIECHFAEKRPDGIYASGAEERFDWYRQSIESGQRGGRKSAQARREKYGTAQPLHATNPPSAVVEPPFDNSPNPPSAFTNLPVPSPAPDITPPKVPQEKERAVALVGANSETNKPMGELALKVQAVDKLFESFTGPPLRMKRRLVARTVNEYQALVKRLSEVPELERWELALKRAAEVPFLCGNAPPRPGRGPFRMTEAFFVKNFHDIENDYFGRHQHKIKVVL